MGNMAPVTRNHSRHHAGSATATFDEGTSPITDGSAFRFASQLRLLGLSAHHGRAAAFVGIGNLFLGLAKSKKAAARRAAAVATMANSTKVTSDFLGRLKLVISSAVSTAFIPVQPLSSDAARMLWCAAADMSCHEARRNYSSDADLDDDSLDWRGAEEESRVFTAASVWWYSKGSAAGDALASLYTGMMTHLGIGAPRSLIRAQRYYKLALRQAAEGHTLHPQLRSLAKLLLWCVTSSQDGRMLQNLILPLERIAKYAFDV